MNVRIYNRHGQPDFPLHECGSDAVKMPYTNKISGESDPIIMFTPPNRWAHESSLLKLGYQIREI